MKVHKELKTRLSLLLVLVMIIANITVANAEVTGKTWGKSKIYWTVNYDSAYYDDDVHSAFIEASIKWSEVLELYGVDVIFVMNSSDPDVVVDFKYYTPGLAETKVSANSGISYEATIDVDMTNVNDGNYSATALEAMALHELGHVLGLDETLDDSKYSIMRRSIDLIENMTSPGSYDIDNIKSIY